MHIWCLTSLEIRDFEERHMTRDQYEAYTQALQGCEKYALTQIFIGKHNVNFEFHLHRKDVGIFQYLMTPDMLWYNKISNDVVDVETAFNNGFGLQAFVRRVRIRCVKSESSRSLTSAQEQYYNNYAKKIEDYANGDPDLREAAFLAPEVGKFDLSNDSGSNPNVGTKRENHRMSDLINALRGLCTEEVRRISKRYDQHIGEKVIINYHTESDGHINYDKDYSKTKEIKLYGIKLIRPWEIIPRWATAINLEVLSLSYVKPFPNAQQWTEFQDAISNCQKLEKLTLHHCELIEIPPTLFNVLPSSLTTLNLGDNNLKTIPSSISALRNLESLCVSYNRELNDKGFPWKDLPETLLLLDLASTCLEAIPVEIGRLKKLQFLYCGTQIKRVKWTSLPHETLRELRIDGSSKLNPPRSVKRFYDNLQFFGLRNAGLHKRFFKRLPFLQGTVDLSYNKFGAFKCLNIADDIKRLYLNNCELTRINWGDIWRCLSGLQHLQLANNNLEEIILMDPSDATCMSLTHLTVHNNQLKTVSGADLPPTLTHLDLSNNAIEEIDSFDCLTKLIYLNISSNILENLPERIERCTHLTCLLAANNRISTIPEGFENIPVRYVEPVDGQDNSSVGFIFLDLSHNRFSFKDSDLTKALWKRLPKAIESLNLSYNNLGSLPCELKSRYIWNLKADECNLKTICPRLGTLKHYRGRINDELSHFHLSIKGNKDLEYLPFVPTTLYFPPKVNDRKVKFHDINKSGPILLTSNTSYKDTDRWETGGKIHNYDLAYQAEGEGALGCSCCALCGAGRSTKKIESFMVMDYTLIVQKAVTPPVKEEYWPGEWKTMVYTRMCKECVGEMKQKVLEFYDDIPITRQKGNKPTTNVAVNRDNPAITEPVSNTTDPQAHVVETTSDQHPFYLLPEQPYEQYVQTDNTIMYYQYYPSSHDGQGSHISAPQGFQSQVSPSTSYDPSGQMYHPPEAEMQYFLPAMQDPSQAIYFSNQMSDEDFQNHSRYL